MDISNFAQYKETEILKHDAFAFNTYICTIPLDFDRVALHWHDDIEIICIKKGTAKVTLGLLPYVANAGSILLALPGELHAIERYDEEVPLEYENIIFSPSILESMDQDWCRRSFLGPLRRGKLHLPTVLTPGTELHAAATPLIAAIDKASEFRKEGYPLAIRGNLLLLFHILYTCREEDRVKPTATEEESEKVKIAITYIRDHYNEPLQILSVADATGYSVVHFSRFFKKITGQTFSEYLMDYRLGAAAQLLAKSDQSVSEIAQTIGFDNLSYFCRIFKHKYHSTPRQYREANGGGG